MLSLHPISVDVILQVLIAFFYIQNMKFEYTCQLGQVNCHNLHNMMMMISNQIISFNPKQLPVDSIILKASKMRNYRTAMYSFYIQAQEMTEYPIMKVKCCTCQLQSPSRLLTSMASFSICGRKASASVRKKTTLHEIKILVTQITMYIIFSP